MVEVSDVVIIDRPSHTVWAELARFGAISRWAPPVDHSCLMSSSLAGVGAVRRVQVGRNALLERIVAWEPGRHLAYNIEGLPPVLRSVTNHWFLDDQGNRTLVTITSAVDAGPRPPQQLIARGFGKILGKGSREMLRGLKHYLEETSP